MKMGIFKKLFNKKKDRTLEESQWEEIALEQELFNIHDAAQREKHITDILNQMGNASKELEQMNFEYNLVTSYLTDMEEVDALPPVEKEELTECAKEIINLEEGRKMYSAKTNHLTDKQYRHMESMREEMPLAFEKIQKAEDFQGLIKQDLKRLEGEKHATFYHKEDLDTMLANSKGIAIICGIAFLVCIAMLAVLQFAFDMNTQVGYWISILAVAIVFTAVSIKYMDIKKELKSVNNMIARLISLQNAVKIRYVNNTHLLEYLYVKFQVNSGKELMVLWDRFQEEESEREKFQKTAGELKFYQEELVKIMRKYHINDPTVWIHQAEALIDSNEMVELRHGLIMRRQKLRKQMEYNKKLGEESQKEIKTLVNTYPQYAKQIVDAISYFEKKYS